MDDLNRLSKALMVLDDKLVTCMKCGLCQAVCPVFGETMQEADVTRGKINLLNNLAHLLITDPEAVNEKLRRCLLCGSCQTNCPSGVKIMDIFLDARAIVTTYLGLSTAKKFIFRGLLPNPRLVNLLLTLYRPLQKLITTTDNSSQDTVCVPMLNPLIGARHLPLVPSTTLLAQTGMLNSPAGKSRLKVAFFAGCMGELLYTDMAEACLKVFDYHEVGVYHPREFVCCGMPALVSGDRQGFTKLVRHNVETLKRGTFDYIVTPCSSCTYAIKELWPELSGQMPYKYRDAINELSQKVMDINAFLVDVVNVRPKISLKRQEKVRLTYHESCHLRNSLKISEQPRKLLRMHPGYELVEMEEADRCCGCGGSFTLEHQELSRQIGQRKRNRILESGAQVVATGCPACMMQLTDMLARNKDAVEVKHTIEVYADSLK